MGSYCTGQIAQLVGFNVGGDTCELIGNPARNFQPSDMPSPAMFGLFGSVCVISNYQASVNPSPSLSMGQPSFKYTARFVSP